MKRYSKKQRREIRQEADKRFQFMAHTQPKNFAEVMMNLVPIRHLERISKYEEWEPTGIWK